MVTLLTSCSNPAGRAVDALGSRVGECCNSLTLKKEVPAGPIITDIEKNALPVLPVSFEEIFDSEILTW